MRQPAFGIIATLLGLIGLIALGYYLTTLPTTLKIAVGPLGNENVRTVSATKQIFQKEREPFRISLVITTGSRQTADALDAGKVDLAVIRPDITLPRNGATVAIMFTENALLVTPGTTGIETVADLKGKTIALLGDNPGNIRLLEIIMAQAGISPENYKTQRVRLPGLRAAFDAGDIHAVMALGANSSKLLLDVVQSVSESGQGKITFIPIPETSAIEQRYPFLEAGTLVRGLFSGQNARPETDIPTLTVSHHLLAAKTLSDNVVSDFTRVFLNAKTQIATEAPLAARIEAPDQEKESPLPIHPGTITYLDGQTSTFLERYGDWFYIAIMGFGLGGSALAAYFGLSASRKRQQVMGMLHALQGLVAEVPEVKDEQGLETLRGQANGIFQQTIQQAIADNVDPAAMTAFNMAFNQFHELVNARRRALSDFS